MNRDQAIKDALFEGYKLLKQAEKTGDSKPEEPKPDPKPTPKPSVERPDQLLDLKNWTLMLPTGNDGDPDNEYPAQKKLNIKDVFFVRKDAVVFRARVDGVHSPNSSYPRSELREMQDEHWTKGAWSNKTGVHTLTAVQAITATPQVKPHVVCTQIHSGADDVIQIRLEGKKLMVMYADGKKTVPLDDNYELGKKFEIQIVAAEKRVKVSYNGVQKADLDLNGNGWYYKIGCYTQSNLSKGDAPESYGEVEVYRLQLQHG